MLSSLWKLIGKGWSGFMQSAKRLTSIWFSGITAFRQRNWEIGAGISWKPYPVQGTGGHLRSIVSSFYWWSWKSDLRLAVNLIQRWRRNILEKSGMTMNGKKKIEKEFNGVIRELVVLRNISMRKWCEERVKIGCQTFFQKTWESIWLLLMRAASWLKPREARRSKPNKGTSISHTDPNRCL